jgi:FkbM family methyltransferase
MALRAHGYGNTGSIENSGESCFLQRLRRERVGLCLDVGANRGEYTEQLLQLCPQAQVIAFEPQPSVFNELEALARRYRGRLHAENVGVGANDGELDIYWGENSELASFSPEVLAIGYVGRCNVNRSRVPVTTLDHYFAGPGRHWADRPITLLKIDTEGFEYEVLAGAQQTLRARPPQYVQIEFNAHQLYRNQTLYSLSRLLPDYTPYQMLPRSGGLRIAAADDPCSNLFLYSNFVFIRNADPIR